MKNFKLILLLNLIFIYDCSVIRKTLTFDCLEGIKLIVDVPKYDFSNKVQDLDCILGFGFAYSDSSIIYCSNTFNANIENIKNQGDSLYQFRFEYGELFRKINRQKGEIVYTPELPDTFELSGIDENGLYWRDLFLYGVSIGYFRVPAHRKKVFDKCLDGIKVCKIKVRK